MLTEQEAKSKWCPMARVQEFDVSGNRSAQNDIVRGSHCIASQCMAWRWVKLPNLSSIGGFCYSAEHGYCGLAGAPQ